MRILLWDIETWAIEGNFWGLKVNGYLGHHQVKRDWGIICAAWRWLGEKKVESVSISPRNPYNDLQVVKRLHEVLSQADVIVAHNGDGFDIKKFRTRAVFHRLPPIHPVKTIDTFKVAKDKFGFTSNRLDYLGKFLGLGRKIRTSHDLWDDVMAGDAKALDKMVRYNKQDVKLLEDVYLILRPYMTRHPNENLTSKVNCCPVCGSKDFIKQGVDYQQRRARQKYQCKRTKCRAWFTGETVATVKLS